ncbi:hypothetical protein [Dyadobacter sp. CY326]|uniref:hypothetical protein n=1 Tax=Dyadobacter sp. CY326 TaxID=2907300 RepID=UPI001F357439|nr:hypothetical protein [Dyadobacter sp. CY326]MCE7066406.1 hypothetical protein [Dyadobacter sp. CY326]
MSLYSILIFLHSIIRWLLLLGLLWSIFVAIRGYFSGLAFSKSHNALRHWTATMSHFQLMVGFTLYTQSPLVQYFFTNAKSATLTDISFFSIIHGSLMLTAIALITIGSALAKRKTDSRDKFKTVAIFYSIALIIILIAIPWPFSPLAQRPYIRLF